MQQAKAAWVLVAINSLRPYARFIAPTAPRNISLQNISVHIAATSITPALVVGRITLRLLSVASVAERHYNKHKRRQARLLVGNARHAVHRYNQAWRSVPIVVQSSNKSPSAMYVRVVELLYLSPHISVLNAEIKSNLNSFIKYYEYVL